MTSNMGQSINAAKHPHFPNIQVHNVKLNIFLTIIEYKQ